mmetsp:Transcript_25046/g.50834  ORF Transcript_25046/g.50834 Transcript_25046/m.50834 type:complete len:290 (-) Transcript_25046:350-1219(-)
MRPLRRSLQRLGQERSEELCHLESIDRDVYGCNALGRAVLAGQHVGGGALLERDVVVVLQEEVWHHLGVCSRLHGSRLLELGVGSLDASHLLPILAHDGHRIARAACIAASVNLELDRLALLGGDAESDAGEVRELLARGARQRKAAGEGGVRLDGVDGVDGHPPIGREERELVDRHILEKPLAVALEALRQLGLCVRVVVHVGGDRPRHLLCRLQRLSHVRRHVLVVPHVHRHALLRRELSHLLELLNRRRARLLQVDCGTTGFDHLAQQPRVVRRPPRDERHPRPAW